MADVLRLILETYGIVGVIVLAPYLASVYLWKDNQRLSKALMEQSEKHAKVVEDVGNRVTIVQDKRISDAQGLSDKLMVLMAERSSLDKETNLALDRIGDMVSMVVNSGGHHLKRGG